MAHNWTARPHPEAASPPPPPLFPDAVLYDAEHALLLPLHDLLHPTLPSLALHVTLSLRQHQHPHRHRRITTSTIDYDDDDDDYFGSAYGYGRSSTPYSPTAGHSPNYTTTYDHTNPASTNGFFNSKLTDFGFSNNTDTFTSHLHPASDVDVEGVVAAMAFNSLVFAVLMISYEVLRHAVPSVYAGKLQQAAMRGETLRHSHQPSYNLPPIDGTGGANGNDEEAYYMPLDWVKPVFGVPWRTVRRAGGLDAYMFLRYIRLCLRITSVSAVWGLVILWPIYGHGGGPYQEYWHSWYHFSMANIDQGSWRIWPPTIFIYLLSFYVFFTMKQEYKHYVELRMEFLGRGAVCGARQQTYSVMVERIPPDLRSDRALHDYFDRLFPRRVHSACVVLNVPDLEVISRRKLRVTRRLEKSIASHEATGRRPTHIVGRPRINVLGIECSPLEVPCGRACHDVHDMAADDDDYDESLSSSYGETTSDRTHNRRPPPRGSIVDSIEYYTQDLADVNHQLFVKQRRKAAVAESGNASVRAYNWITRAADYAADVADTIIDESMTENALTLGGVRSSESTEEGSSSRRSGPGGDGRSDRRRGVVGRVVSGTLTKPTYRHYGSFDDDDDDDESNWDESTYGDEGAAGGGGGGVGGGSGSRSWDLSVASGGHPPTEGQADHHHHHHGEVKGQASPRMAGGGGNSSSSSFIQERKSQSNLPTPYLYAGGCRPQERTFWRRLAGRLGLDFFVSAVRLVNRRLRIVVDNVVGTTMSSTGFVTFTTHQSATIAACAPLTHKPNALDVTMAPEPRDLLWNNASISADITRGKEVTANVLLGFGAILWSIPLAAIQAFAKAEQLAMIPGMEWVLTFDGGNLKAFINGYLPVVALLCLILILPFVFEFIAKGYENRKTKSDIQESIVGRYFYYQVANIYITVTAGSIWKALADILDHPAEILEILGESIPMMVGYFMSFLITKILAGLPMLILRGGALSRMLLLRSCFTKRKLTQRELDEVYRNETIFYGWEYPTQLLVIMICFAYAVISPVILPFGALYFLGALMVYKKQVLYVYSPTYESGGKLFPIVCDRTLFGLICGQLTFIGYSIIRKGQWQPLFLSPLPFITLYMMSYFRVHYANPSLKLSLERAIELDHVADAKASPRKGTVTPGSGAQTLASKFTEDFYRQPVLTEEAGRPMPYRRGDGMDELTAQAMTKLQGGASRYQMMVDETRKGIAPGSTPQTSHSGRRKLSVSLVDSGDTEPTKPKDGDEFEPPEHL